ncbi:MAG: hypothetical protein AAF581_19200 [Planctomycetota bacterium]
MRTPVLIVALFLTLGVVAEDELPSGADLCDRAEAAIGDAKKIAAIETIATQVKVTYKNMGAMEGTMNEYFARPMKACRKTNFAQMGEMLEGTDGKVFWEINPMQGPTVHSGNAKVLKEHDYASKLMVPWREIYKEAKCLGVTKVGDSDCYKVELTPKEGRKEICYYDKETMLTRKVELIFDEPMSGQQLPIELIFDDYRPVNGIKHAFKVRVKVSVMDIEWEYTSIKHNAKLPAGVFDLPSVIRKAAKGTDSSKKPKAKPQDQ